MWPIAGSQPQAFGLAIDLTEAEALVGPELFGAGDLVVDGHHGGQRPRLGPDDTERAPADEC